MMVNLSVRHKDIISGILLLFFFVFYSCKMDMSSLHNGDMRWHFPGCCTLNQRDQQYVECQHGDIWFPFHSCSITAGMPVDITILPSWHWACHTFYSTSVFSKKLNNMYRYIHIYIYISQENVKPLLLLDTLYLQHRMRKSLVTQLK